MTASAHGPDCECARCVGFRPGNGVAVRHGAYSSPARLGDEVAELSAELTELVPAFRESDGPLVSLVALALRRIQRAEAAVTKAEECGDLESVKTLRSDLRGWVNSAARMLDSLGMSPTARARLGLDVALTRRALTVTELHAAAALEGEAEEEPAT